MLFLRLSVRSHGFNDPQIRLELEVGLLVQQTALIADQERRWEVFEGRKQACALQFFRDIENQRGFVRLTRPQGFGERVRGPVQGIPCGLTCCGRRDLAAALVDDGDCRLRWRVGAVSPPRGNRLLVKTSTHCHYVELAAGSGVPNLLETLDLLN